VIYSNMLVFKIKFYYLVKELWLNKDKDIALFFWMKPSQFSVYQNEWVKMLYSLAKKMFKQIKDTLGNRDLLFDEIFNIELIKWYRPERIVEYEFAKKGSVNIQIFMPFVDFIVTHKKKCFILFEVLIAILIISLIWTVYFILKRYYIW